MKRGISKLALIFFLFIFGLLFGLQSKNRDAVELDARNTFIDSTHYISRIENGQFVFEPIPQEKIEQTNNSNYATGDHQSKNNIKDETANILLPNEGPKMNKKGKLDQMGKKLGSKFSQLTRATLETSFSLFTK